MLEETIKKAGSDQSAKYCKASPIIWFAGGEKA
jgi:hypothetical protein